MSKRKSKAKPKKQTPSTFEYEGITFRFDNESLQKEYVKALSKYEKLELNIPTNNVSYVDAVSLTRGKYKQRLDDWLANYDANDFDYKKGIRHKYDMYDKIREKTSKNALRYQLDKLDKYKKLVDKANKKWGTTTRKGSEVSRYNVVWYSDGGKNGSPV